MAAVKFTATGQNYTWVVDTQYICDWLLFNDNTLKIRFNTGNSYEAKFNTKEEMEAASDALAAGKYQDEQNGHRWR